MGQQLVETLGCFYLDIQKKKYIYIYIRIYVYQKVNCRAKQIGVLLMNLAGSFFFWRTVSDKSGLPISKLDGIDCGNFNAREVKLLRSSVRVCSWSFGVNDGRPEFDRFCPWFGQWFDWSALETWRSTRDIWLKTAPNKHCTDLKQIHHKSGIMGQFA